MEGYKQPNLEDESNLNEGEEVEAEVKKTIGKSGLRSLLGKAVLAGTLLFGQQQESQASPEDDKAIAELSAQKAEIERKIQELVFKIDSEAKKKIAEWGGTGFDAKKGNFSYGEAGVIRFFDYKTIKVVMHEGNVVIVCEKKDGATQFVVIKDGVVDLNQEVPKEGNK